MLPNQMVGARVLLSPSGVLHGEKLSWLVRRMYMACKKNRVYISLGNSNPTRQSPFYNDIYAEAHPQGAEKLCPDSVTCPAQATEWPEQRL